MTAAPAARGPLPLAKIPQAWLLLAALAATASASEPGQSASRDAPVLELAYGPRAQLSLGHRLPLWRGLSVQALAALEDAGTQGPIPDQLGRLVLDLDWQVPLGWRPGGAALALGFDLGFEAARKLGGVEAERVLPPPRPGDIPFGGGGEWTGVSLAAGFQLGPRTHLRVALRERVFLNGWPLLLGRRDWSDVVADSLEEGLAHAPSLDVTLRFQRNPCFGLLAALYAEGLFPHDRSADASGFVRLLGGAVWPWHGGEAIPFLSLDLGAGKGLLVNRHELRLSVGVRHAF